MHRVCYDYDYVNVIIRMARRYSAIQYEDLLAGRLTAKSDGV